MSIVGDLVLLSLDLFKSGVDLLRPLVEDLLKVVDHLLVYVGVVMGDLLGLCLPLGWVGLQHDVGLQGTKGLNELLGELVEGVHELLLLLRLALGPLVRLELVDHRLVNLVDDRVHRGNGVLGDFSEKHIVVGSLLGVDGLARRDCPHEVDTLTTELDLLA